MGVEVPGHLFLNHPDPDVCNVSVDILTSDDNYVMSQLWLRKEVHIESETEILAVGVPKAVALYKSKIIEELIKEQRTRLEKEEATEEEVMDALQRLALLNNARVAIAKKLKRLIL